MKFQERLQLVPARVWLVVCLIVIVGCRSEAPNPSNRGTPSAKPRVALIMKSLANEFFATMEEAVK